MLADLPSATIDHYPPPGIYRNFTVGADVSGWSGLSALDPEQALEAAKAHARITMSRADDKNTQSFSDTITEVYADPATSLSEEQKEIASKRVKAIKDTSARIQSLKTEAKAEGYSVSLESERDLRTFLKGRVFTVRPYASLLDNGNLRLLWKNDANEQIGLQFRGGGEIQFVLFARRADAGGMNHSSGRGDFAHVERQLAANDLERLMTE